VVQRHGVAMEILKREYIPPTHTSCRSAAMLDRDAVAVEGREGRKAKGRRSREAKDGQLTAWMQREVLRYIFWIWGLMIVMTSDW
jgi:hypothetical protein